MQDERTKRLVAILDVQVIVITILVLLVCFLYLQMQPIGCLLTAILVYVVGMAKVLGIINPNWWIEWIFGGEA